jgi:alginate O-acetyltransferase complex protein AlgI
MLFSELQFFVFFAGYFAVHLILPAKYRIYLIIAGGAVFYGWWRADYLWVPVLLSVLAFGGVSWIESAGEASARSRRQAVVIACILAPLLLVKYSYFVVTNVSSALGAENAAEQYARLKVGLPLGISFITFSAIAYVVDVYRKRFPAERQFTVLLAYIMFFPHLIAGPILRPHELIPQIKQLRTALGARFITGIGIFTLGLFKKLVIADQLASVVDPVFNSGAASSGFAYLLAIYGFSAQIYCDFSGYTDMAIGLAYMLRIRLPTNFLRPYRATSILDFWRRWHITLSHWLRDYLYIPLGGNRTRAPRQSINLLVTMAIGGLWHGANWTFLIWGLLHGVALTLNHRLRSLFQWMPKGIATFATFQFVTFAWIFFRAPDLSTAMKVLQGPFVSGGANIEDFVHANTFTIMILSLFFLTHRFDRHALVRRALQCVPWPVAIPAMAFIWIIAFTLSQGNSAKFIYFDF